MIKTFRSIQFTPFLSGALVAGEITSFYYLEFLIVTGILFLNSYYLASSAKGVVHNIIFVTLNFGLLFLWYLLLQDPVAVFLLLLAGVFLQFLEQIQNILSPKLLLLKQFILVLFMSVLSILGFVSQHQGTFWFGSILGFVPGFILSAAMVADSTKMLESYGWKRLVEKQNRRGEKIFRPGSIAQLFVILLVIGPVIVVTMTLVGNLLPNSFVLIVFAVARMPNLATAFMENQTFDLNISQAVTKLAAWTSLGLFVIGAVGS